MSPAAALPAAAAARLAAVGRRASRGLLRRERGVLLLALVLVLHPGCALLELHPFHRVHAFYYLWYGEPSTAGAWQHWNHEVLPHWDPATAAKFPRNVQFEPPTCLHSPFYPMRGPYSSSSADLIRQHLDEAARYGIGVLVASWWGPSARVGTHDTQGVNTDERLGQLIGEIEASGSPVRVAFHLEPYEGRTKYTVYEDLVYLAGKYRTSPAVLRIDGRPVFYVYDSYRLPARDWAELFKPNDGHISIRGTVADGFFIGLWLNREDGDKGILAGGFDGAYSYFSSEAVSWASNPNNWGEMLRWAQRNGLLFVPSIGPGYNDSKIRPWNLGATRDRANGSRFQRQWDTVLAADAAVVSVTSFNEWGEGTQIEPAVPRTPVLNCEYLSYEPGGPYMFMEIVRVGAEVLYKAAVRQYQQAAAAEEAARGAQEEGGGAQQRPPHPEMDGSGPSSSSTSGIPDALPVLGGEADWREFRARLISQSHGAAGAPADSGEWAHVITKPEKGALLLAHPLMFQTSQTYFHRSAILLLEHGDMGSYGVILNRPSKFFLRDVPLSRPLAPQFGESRLYVGGDVGSGEVQVVHPYELPGAVEVVKGIWVGGIDGAQSAVNAGRAKASDFRWFSGYAGWAQGQLAMECKRGVWFTAAASPKVLLSDVGPDETPKYWHKVLRLMGGTYEELSKAVEKHDGADIEGPLQAE